MPLLREKLTLVTEEVAFDLKASDVRGMGYPLAVACAAYLVQLAGGVIVSDGYRWMVPEGDEVRVLADLT